MNKLFLSSATYIICALFSCSYAKAQTIDKPLPHFEKLVVSPLINVVLTEGEQENIRLEYQGIEPQKINYTVKGKTLSIYLDDARITIKNCRHYDDGYSYKRPVYEGVQITAYITYRQLHSLEVRGGEHVTCESPLVENNFKLKIYGQSRVTLTALQANHLKAYLYGENKLTILSGNADTQIYRVYGENRIETKNFTSKHISTRSLGESHFNLHASDGLSVTALGESDIYNTGRGRTSKKLVIGRANIQHAR